MKTTIRKDAPDGRFEDEAYALEHLENANEIRSFISAAESILLPCSHCGFPKPSIRYNFRPKCQDPHGFHVWCASHDFVDGDDGEPLLGCWNRTFEYRAADEIEDMKYTLSIIIAKWNLRLGDSWPNDSWPDDSWADGLF
jgi:hypothetical protein